jgi:hypothetical protein
VSAAAATAESATARVRGRVATRGSNRDRSVEAKVADVVIFGARQYAHRRGNPSSVSQLALCSAREQDRAAINRKNHNIAKYSPVPGMKTEGPGGFIESTGRLGPAVHKFLTEIGHDKILLSLATLHCTQCLERSLQLPMLIGAHWRW